MIVRLSGICNRFETVNSFVQFMIILNIEKFRFKVFFDYIKMRWFSSNVFEIPKIFPPSFCKDNKSHEPLNPVCPVIKIFYL